MCIRDRKANYLQQNPRPSEEENLPDMQELPAVTKVQERGVPFEINRDYLDQMVTEVSAVFNEYGDIYNSSVSISGMEIDMYRLTTEGVQLKQPGGQVTLTVSAEVRSGEGSKLGDSVPVPSSPQVIPARCV